MKLRLIYDGSDHVEPLLRIIPELRTHGVNGWLCDRDPDALAEGVLHCHTHYGAMAAAMQRTIAAWDWSSQAAKYWGLFRGLAHPRAPAA